MNTVNEQAGDLRTATNRQNAKKSTGPHDTTATRYNATKHGLLAKGVTEMDNPESYNELLSQLEREHQPIGLLESEIVAQIAIGIVRTRRARMLEAEEITAGLNPAKTRITRSDLEQALDKMGPKVEVLDPGLPARLQPRVLETITTTILRYETANENKIFRCLSQLERLQQQRRDRKPSSSGCADLGDIEIGEGLASLRTNSSAFEKPPLD